MTRLYLGVDGGGTKTAFALIDSDGRVLARHQGRCSYYLQTGLEGLDTVLRDGVAAVLSIVGARAEAVSHAFFGLPAHGEDSGVQPQLDLLPQAALGHGRFTCGNDMICGWAGSLAGEDGVNIVAGTGSIAYGEYRGRAARAGGWGEAFSDEGSAYWIATQGLNLFTRMSDGRLDKGPLHTLLKAHFQLESDLDLCGRVLGHGGAERDRIAALSLCVAEAARQGDDQALDVFARAGRELAAMIRAIRARLDYAADEITHVSWSGGVFQSGDLILEPFRRALPTECRLVAPLLPPDIGAALYAARIAGEPLASEAIDRLRRAA